MRENEGTVFLKQGSQYRIDGCSREEYRKAILYQESQRQKALKTPIRGFELVTFVVLLESH
jgi:hypothetical protein